MKNGYRVFDSDMHVFEPHDLYLRYMSPRWGDRIPRKEPRRDYELEVRGFGLADGKPVRAAPEDADLTEVLRHRYAQEAGRYRNALDHDFDAPSQLVAMDAEGLDVAVLFRSGPLIADDSLEPEYALALARAWNNWITEFCGANPARMKAAALIPLHDVDMAVDETRRVIKRLGHVAVCLAPEPNRGRHLHDPYYDPLWAELARVNVPATFHWGGRGTLDTVTHRFAGHPNSAVLTGVFQNTAEEMMALASLIVGGVLERFPKLRVAVLEGNASWVPWLLYRMDERWDQRGKWEKVELSMKPSDYFLRQCFVSVDPNEYLVSDVVRRIGADNLIFSTYYPHQDSHFPEAADTLLRTLEDEDVSEEAKRKILWENCVRLYNLSKEDVGAAMRRHPEA